jgi:3'-phosphoadenosine 5'-phosphosulfate sulfotransferase (PAPS reductase)/FAD synthetase
MFWLTTDVWEYIRTYKIPYCGIYDTGVDGTGCMYCIFGIVPQTAKGENRFQIMKRTHPAIYDYCINKLGIGAVLDFMGIPY